MSARLLAALDRYDETVANAAVVIPYTPPTTKKYKYSELLTEKADLQSELSTLTKGSAEQKEVLTVLQQLMDDLRGLYSKQLEGITEIDGKPIRDIIAEATEKFETDYAEIDLSYGLDALEEASRIYQKRIDTIIEVNANTPYPDYNPSLALTDYWEKGSRFTFSLPNGDGTSKSYSVTLPSQSSSVTIPSALGYDGSQTLGVTLNGIVQKADYQYAVSSDYQRIVKVGENLLPAKRRVDELIEEKRVLVETVQDKISATEQAIADLNWMIAKENPDNFTSEHIAELNHFIKEDVYRNADIGIPDLTDGYGTPEYYQATSQLYRDGKNAFATLFQPPVSFTIDIINFMGVLSCQDDWDRLSLGDMIHVCHADAARPDYIVRVIRIEHDGKNQTINLGLTNQDNLKTADVWFDEVIRGAHSTASLVGQNKDLWTNAEQNAVDTIYNNTLDAARTTIQTADNQKMTLNHRGVNMSSTLEANKGKELQLMNNILALTKDGWQTVSAAVTADGVIAEQIIGTHLWGKQCTVQATNADGTIATFEVDGSGVRIDNNTLVIRGTNEDLVYDPKTGIGLVITNAAKTFRVVLNSKDGLYFQKGNGAGSWQTKPVYIDMAGNAYFDGILRVRQLYLRDRDIEGIISDRTTGGTDKISAKYICGNYLQAIGTDGTERVSIDGSTGKIAIKDGSISITKPGVASVSLSPTSPLTVYNEKTNKNVFALDVNGNVVLNDITANNGTFQGRLTGQTDIEITGDVTVGQNIHIRQLDDKWFTTGGLYFDSVTSGAPSGWISVYDAIRPVFRICSPNNGDVEVTTGTSAASARGDLILRGRNVRLGNGAGGGVYVNWDTGEAANEKYRVATRENLDDLKNEIQQWCNGRFATASELASLRQWVSQNFAPINHSHPEAGE